MSRIKYKSCFHVETIAPEQVFLFSERENQMLLGKLHYLLAPFLRTGKYTKDQIVDALGKKASAATVYYALERLEKAGLIEDLSDNYPAPFVVFCQQMGTTPKIAQQALQTSSIFIQSIGKIDRKAIQKTLRSQGVRISATRKKATLTLLLCDDYLNLRLGPVQKQLFRENRSYLMAKPVGSELWIGPLLVPKETGCAHCLSIRLKQNQIEDAYVQNHKKNQNPFPFLKAEVNSTKNLATNWIATEIFKHLIRPDRSLLKGKILSFDLLGSKIAEHKLIKLPDCPQCGEKPGKNPLVPLELRSRKKGIYDENGWRSVAPETTIKKHEHLVSPILGFVQFLEPVDQKQGSSLHLYHAGHNFAFSNSVRGIHPKNFRSMSGGKGRTATQAKASALCEAIERFSGLFQGSERCVRASYREMKAKGALHPKTYIQFSAKQLKEREKRNKDPDSAYPIPFPFSENEKIEWTPIWSLSDKQYKYVPTSYCYYRYRDEKTKSFYLSDSNGNAAGNNLEEAILQGFFELVERDAVAIWWYNRLKKPNVDILSFKDPYFSELLTQYKEMKREVWALDLTTDLNIPVFCALSRKIDSEHEEIYMGFGAHLQPEIALLRALTEMNQFLSMNDFWNEESTSEDAKTKIYKYWFTQASIQNQPYLSGQKVVRADDFPQRESKDLLEDIHFCQKIVESKGMEFLVLDQTRPDIDLKVVKVIVPGLRHFWPQFAPGRLYDVPVEMGWLKTRTKEEELNPIPMFL